MAFIHDLAAQRRKFLEGLDANEGDINLDIFEDFYPDQAHFIFELLQNAEDAEATDATFTLSQHGCVFEHNGRRAFDEKDVRAITGIYNSTKRKSPDQIGKFGVGFKSVFVYTITPIIHSAAFSFKISRLVLPEPLEADPQIAAVTRFELPFNNPKKSSVAAYEEVKRGLEDLAETTLLFLSNLECVRWKAGQGLSGEVRRINHSDRHIEVLKRAGGKTIASSHFLRFSDSVSGLEKRCVAVAFALDRLPNFTEFEPNTPLAKQFKIVPANRGRVAVFFPAEKETSGLRFHLHGPFVPELSRASIKETSANNPLFTQLAELAAASLYSISEMNLLTSEFLGVLPNPQDTVPPRYTAIRSAIIEEMNNNALTPTHSKSLAPAKHLLQAKASLKELLSPEDIEFLVEYETEPPQWAVSASQRNSNADRFLSGLAITNWDVEDFVELLDEKLSEGTRYLEVEPWVTDEPDEVFAEWLASKSAEWHQQFYALLHSELPTNYERRQAIERLKQLRIVRLSDGRYSTGPKSYFPSDGVEHDEVLPRVDQGVYTSGKSKVRQEEARKLLEEIKVREVGEVDEIESILKQRYTYDAEVPDSKTYWKDLKRFIAMVEKEPQQAKLFADFYIFKRVDEKWSKPSQVYLDSPLLDTGLKAYYDALGKNADRVAISAYYQNGSIGIKALLSFAEKVGAKGRLSIKQVSCRENPAATDLVWRAPGGWSDSYGINRDYTIEGLKAVLGKNNEALARLIWKTACNIGDTTWLEAQYRNNSNYSVRRSPSQIVCLLRESAWVPQTDGRFARPSEASRELLPSGFPFDKGSEWLKAVGFEQHKQNSVEETKKKEAVAKELGFPDRESLDRAKQFVALPKDDQERILAEFRRRHNQELPEHEPRNPDQRAERVRQKAATAPERITEERLRSVSVGREEVKQETDPYLREQYTNSQGEMICQICKHELPFKLDDGSYYFEKQEFLAELTRRHHQNYLALCPNHRAMFQHANGSRELMKDMLCELVGNELEVVLAHRDTTIYFTKTHLADLRTVIEVDDLHDASDLVQDTEDDAAAVG